MSNPKLSYRDLTNLMQYIKIIGQNNDMIDHTGVAYAKNKT